MPLELMGFCEESVNAYPHPHSWLHPMSGMEAECEIIVRHAHLGVPYSDASAELKGIDPRLVLFHMTMSGRHRWCHHAFPLRL